MRVLTLPALRAVADRGGRVHAPGVRAAAQRGRLPRLVLPLPRLALRHLGPHPQGARAIQPGGPRLPVRGGQQGGHRMSWGPQGAGMRASVGCDDGMGFATLHWCMLRSACHKFNVERLRCISR